MKHTDIDTWIFDLDNTLYPSSCNLFDQIDVRMGAFIAELLGVDAVEARRVQKDYLVRHGTTLRGLMDYHDVEAEDFLNYVHDIDMSPIPPNPNLGEVIAALPGRKYVFTNADRPYAEKVLGRLGFGHVFDGLFDIVDAAYHPKPVDETYRRFVAKYEIDPTRSIMFEDMARNLTPAHHLGIATVWLPTGTPWSSAGQVEEHIDYVIDDLADWLRAHPSVSD